MSKVKCIEIQLRMQLRTYYTYQTTQITIVFEGTYLQIILRIKIKYLQKWDFAKTLKAKNCRLQKGASIGKR